jgi:hypothetical protein
MTLPTSAKEQHRFTPSDHGSEVRKAENSAANINPLETLIDTRDIMADFRASTQRIVHARCGETGGNRVGVTVPGALYTGQTPSDRSGLATVEVPFSASIDIDAVTQRSQNPGSMLYP